MATNFILVSLVLTSCATAQTISQKTCSSSDCAYQTVECVPDECDILCSGSNACKSLTIMADNTDKITINCQTNNACNDMVIHGTYSKELNFIADWTDTQRVTIYANHSSNLTVICIGSGSCQHMQIVATNAKSVSLLSKYENAFGQSRIDVSQSNFVNITCSSMDLGNAQSCYLNTLYLPDYGQNTHINCFGQGCGGDFGDIYVPTSVISLTVNMNGCNGECGNVKECMKGQTQGSWNIHCMVGNVSVINQYYGDYCGSINGNYKFIYYKYCDCQQISQRSNSSTLTWSDIAVNECTTANRKGADRTTASERFTAIGAAIGGVIVFSCLVICCIYFCKRQKSVDGMRHTTQPLPRAQQPQQQIVYVQAMPQQQQPLQGQQVMYVQSAPAVVKQEGAVTNC
eukprot:438776_1